MSRAVSLVAKSITLPRRLRWNSVVEHFGQRDSVLAAVVVDRHDAAHAGHAPSAVEQAARVVFVQRGALRGSCGVALPVVHAVVATAERTDQSSAHLAW